MRTLSLNEANTYLFAIGKKIGTWNGIEDLTITPSSKGKWMNYRAPCGAKELFNFASHVAGWLPKGKWKILKIDNSTCFDAVQDALLKNSIFGPDKVLGQDLPRTIWFDCSSNEELNDETELLISNLIHLFLLFEGHAYLVSEGSDIGQCLSIQDGFAYFSAWDEGVGGAASLLENFQRDPLRSPSWITKIVIDGQEREIDSP